MWLHNVISQQIRSRKPNFPPKSPDSQSDLWFTTALIAKEQDENQKKYRQYFREKKEKQQLVVPAHDLMVWILRRRTRTLIRCVMSPENLKIFIIFFPSTDPSRQIHCSDLESGGRVWTIPSSPCPQRFLWRGLECWMQWRSDASRFSFIFYFNVCYSLNFFSLPKLHHHWRRLIPTLTFSIFDFLFHNA